MVTQYILANPKTDLLSGEDESLLRRWDPLLLLYSLLDPLDLVCRLDVDLDLLASQCLHLNQHRDGQSFH